MVSPKVQSGSRGFFLLTFCISGLPLFLVARRRLLPLSGWQWLWLGVWQVVLHCRRLHTWELAVLLSSTTHRGGWHCVEC